MLRVFLVGAGGFLGAILRYAVGGWVHHILDNAWFPYGTLDLPIVVEIVDSLEKIEAFLPAVDGAIREGLATLEKVQIRFYRSGIGQSDA
jgi:uncharacterized protein